MSSNPKWTLEVIPHGTGFVLDLGGGPGKLRRSLEERGYHYVNMDITRFENGEPSLLGDAHWLPFKDGILDMVVSKDSLVNFREPWAAVQEVRRVLKEGGQFIVWTPFMHPCAGDVFYHYAPCGLQYLLRDFETLTFESPLWVFTVVGSVAIAICKRIHLSFLEWPTRQVCGWLDRLVMQRRMGSASFGAAYRVVMRKPNGIKNDDGSLVASLDRHFSTNEAKQ